ncbi:helix-turn-helix domain-containing protein [Gordonia sp. HNM0687]|uniref:Helix-turn-helix domain-containing protein n=1 Tax=Gordonia mangrovi TaxID=2665643 RepID=A0A6L7GVK0_9ACTN|nr:AraC family transcriptional regulator [Gordonia mangrovi]MXP23999.1 helix-turn-helix domain-containing protein [Gordonia mangrovi]UVF76543.1 AraC family transcriptional regulator [Gordonia mangrovi]
MDALGSLLNGPRAQSPMMLRMVMRSPWSIRIEDTAPLTVVTVARGSAVLTYDDGTTHTVAPGDVALARGTHPYTFGEQPGTDWVARIDAHGDCFDPTGTHSVAEDMCFGVRSWGNCNDDEAADAIMLIGTYATGEVSQGLLDALDRCTVVPMPEHPLVGLMEDEIVRDSPAQEAVLNRLLDLLLITGLRQSMESGRMHATQWYRAHSDPVVGHALRLLHNDIEQPWTVGSLAAATGVSRAVLARRFTDLVGEPPMAYLTAWRMSVAADLLADRALSLSAVARRVGYGTPFAFSAAFKRHRGMSPAAFRAARPRDGSEPSARAT